MRRPEIMGHHGKWPRRLLLLWQGYEAMAAEITLYHPDDVGETHIAIETPSWLFRWVCWVQGHRPLDTRIPKDNYCVVCRRRLT